MPEYYTISTTHCTVVLAKMLIFSKLLTYIYHIKNGNAFCSDISHDLCTWIFFNLQNSALASVKNITFLCLCMLKF